MNRSILTTSELIPGNCFFFLLNELSNKLQRNGDGPQVHVPLDKQLQVAMWYIANIASMREVAHKFGLSMSTVHGRCL